MNMSTLKIGTIVPLSGPSGLHGPSVCNAMNLAVEQINTRGGLLGRTLKPVFIDGGLKPITVASTIQTYLENDLFDILIGFHDSDVRRAIKEACEVNIPYIYTPPYEGGEDHPSMFIIGETPKHQLTGAVPWLGSNLDCKKWYLIGNDYSWPRDLNKVAKAMIAELGYEVVGEQYAPLGNDDFEDYLTSIREAKPDIVFFSLVGNDAIAFNRQFYERPRLKDVVRFGPLLDENVLLGIGSEASDNIYSVSSYNIDLQNQQNIEFLDAYYGHFGDNAAMITSLGQSCYEALSFIEMVAQEAGNLSLDAFRSVAEGLTYAGVRGDVSMTGRHFVQDIHLARSEGFQFELITTFPKMSA